MYESKKLIIEFNGSILFNTNLRLLVGLINALILASSIICLLAILLTMQEETRTWLLKCFLVSQICLSLFALGLMARLWFVPLKMNPLQEGNEQSVAALEMEIANYTYMFAPDSRGYLPDGSSVHSPRSPGLKSSRSQHQSGARLEFPRQPYIYQSTIDKLQRSFACCGISGPHDWVRLNGNLKLFAPSCCLEPLIIEPAGQAASATPAQRVAFCLYSPEADIATGGALLKRPTVDHHGRADELWATAPLGCRQAIGERETRAVFQLRLGLLFLLAVLFFNILAQMAAFAPDARSGGTSSRRRVAVPLDSYHSRDSQSSNATAAPHTAVIWTTGLRPNRLVEEGNNRSSASANGPQASRPPAPCSLNTDALQLTLWRIWTLRSPVRHSRASPVLVGRNRPFENKLAPNFSSSVASVPSCSV